VKNIAATSSGFALPTSVANHDGSAFERACPTSISASIEVRPLSR